MIKNNNEEDPSRVFMKVIQDGRGVEDILEAMKIFLENVAFWDGITGNVHVASRSENFITQVRRLPLHELVAIYPHGTVEDGGDKLGYVLYYHGEGLDQKTRSEALSFGLTALRLSLGGRRQVLREDQHIREEIVRGLAAGNRKLAEKVIRKANNMGWHVSGSMVAMVAEHRGGGDLSGSIGFLSGWLKSRYPNAIQGTVADDLVVLTSATDLGWKKKLEQDLAEYVGSSSTKVPFRIGVGSVASDPMDFGKSYLQARKSIDMGRRMIGHKTVMFWDDMEVMEVLASVPWNDRTRGFIDRYLGNLAMEKDRELLLSLRSLVRSSWNLKVAARDLSIHYNTMRYRYDKITSITGINDDDPWTRTSVTLAVLLDEISEDLGRK